MNDQPLSETSLQSVLDRFPEAERYLVAYSGGLDSTVLLYLMAILCRDKKHSLLALHVNHGLSPAAGDWADHCRKICRELDVGLEIMNVDAGNSSGQGPEDAARNARYAALEQHTGSGDILLTAHQQDDQAETLLLQLLRGGGPEGLASMPSIRPFGAGLHARPLLGVCRDDLRKFAEREHLHWIEDDSNRDVRYDRNFIRSELMPLLKRRWPSATVTLARATRHQADARTLLRELAAEDLASTADLPGDQLCVRQLRNLSRPRAANLLRYWLHVNGMPLPSAAIHDQLLDEMLTAAADAMPCVRWGDVEVRRYQQRLHVMKPLPEHNPESCYSWNLSGTLALPGGTLTARETKGKGISRAYLDDRDLTVRFRKGGESLKPAGQACHRDLKKLFQEASVPPWQRDRIPLLYDGNRLLAVAGYWIDADCHAREDEPGWQIRFMPSGW